MPLGKFPQDGRTHSEDWFRFDSEVRILLKNATPGIDPNGLLGWVLSPADYLLLRNPQPLVPFALAPDPGPRPAAANFPGWKYDADTKVTQQIAMSSVTLEIITACDGTSLTRARGPESIENVPLPIAYGRLTAAYAVASPSALSASYDTLLRPFTPPGLMPDHCLRHSEAHLFALRSGHPYDEVSKVRHFRASLASCGLFTTALLIWDSAHPLVADQTWASISDAMLFAAASLSSASTASLGYALAAVATPVLATSPLEDLQAEVTALRLALAVQSGPRAGGHSVSQPAVSSAATGRGPTRTSAAAPRSGSAPYRGRPTTHPHPNGPGHFCWSHPSQAHPGTECNNRLPGHQVTASWANKMNSPCH
jgi:hypothetical protein